MNINITARGEGERLLLSIEGKDATPAAFLRIIRSLVCDVAVALRQAGVSEPKIASMMFAATLDGLASKPNGDCTATVIGMRNPGG